MGRFTTVAAIIESLGTHSGMPAIVTYHQSSPRTLSFSDLKMHVDRLANGLHAGGVAKADFIVLLAPNSPEWIISALAIIKAGAIVVPLSAQTDQQTLKTILKDIAPKLVFTISERMKSVLDTELITASNIVLMDKQKGEQSWQSWMRETQLPLSIINSEDVAALFYTSGTMGVPKGVPLTHGNLTFQVNAVLDTKLLHDDDRLLLPLPLHHIYPFTIGMLLPLAEGVPTLMPQSLSGPQIMRAIQEGNATILFGVPRLYSALSAAITENVDSLPAISRLSMKGLIKISALLSSTLHIQAGKLLLHPLHKRIGPRLRMLCSGGAALDPQVGRSLEGLGWPVAVGYGLTETSPLLTMRWPGKGSLESVGHVIPGVDLRIDPEAWHKTFENQEAPVSGPLSRAGEIQARGPAVTSGYRNLPDKTAQAFTEDGWFRTGDVGYLRNGELHVVGRMSSLIVTASGKKIDPEELEAYYMLNPILKEIGIVRRNGRLVAVIVPNIAEIQSSGGGDIDRLVRDALDERALHLPTYKRLSGYALCSQPLARTAMGKLQRRTLEELYDRLSKGRLQPRKSDEQDLTVSEEDQALLEHPVAHKVWRWLHKRYRDADVSLDTNPQLELNVDSLEWLTLALQIRELSDVELDEDAIARITTVRDLLRELVQAADAHLSVHPADPLEEPEKFISPEDKKWLMPLNPLQRCMQWFIYRLNWLVMRLLFGIEVIGVDNITEHNQFLLAPNHASFLDPFVLAAAIPLAQVGDMRWAGWTGIAFANSFNRFFSRLAHGIPIDADHALVSSLAMGSAVLKQKQSLIWFPEGRRTLTGEILPFKAGIGLVLHRYPVSVIPVYLDGTGKALPPGSWLVRPTKIRVVFGEPQSPAQLEATGTGAKPEQRIASALRDCVTDLKNDATATRPGLRLTGPTPHAD